MNRFWLQKIAATTAFSLFVAVALASGQSATQTKGGSSAAPKAAPATPAKPATPAAKPAASEKLDINTATKEELAKLPGIGDVLSQKIIDNRPYKSKDELTKKKLINEATYAKITDLIIAKQPKTEIASAKDTKPAKTAPATKAVPASPAAKAPAAAGKEKTK